MQYSCGNWIETDNLENAQMNKMKLIAKKLDLKPGLRVLDIGCGWGTLCKYLVETYGVERVGLTVSKDGCKYAERLCEVLPVKIYLQDYREVNEQNLGLFDRILSIEMFEHIGFQNYKQFFKVSGFFCICYEGLMMLNRNHS